MTFVQAFATDDPFGPSVSVACAWVDETVLSRYHMA